MIVFDVTVFPDGERYRRAYVVWSRSDDGTQCVLVYDNDQCARELVEVSQATQITIGHSIRVYGLRPAAGHPGLLEPVELLLLPADVDPEQYTLELLSVQEERANGRSAV